jgi:hypothetical protein
MKKVIYVVLINDTYLPELRKITIPNIQQYAKKIGADFQLITERKYPDWPITYEKLQIYELGKDNDWNICIDADTLIHTSFYDVTQQYKKDTVSFNFAYNANDDLKPDMYFVRDGRNVGVATNFVVTSNWTHDLWTPLDMRVDEAKTCVTRHHIVDEYCISRNLARYGLKYLGIAPTSETQKMVFHIGAENEEEAISVRRAHEYLDKHFLRNTWL